MAVSNSKKKGYRNDEYRFPWALVGAVVFGGLSILMLYAILIAPDGGMLSGLRGTLRGLGGNVSIFFPMTSVWLCVVCSCAAAGKGVSPWRLIANILLIVCLFSAIELFFLPGVERANSVILSWADFVAKAYRYGRGGGALGALAAAALYPHLGTWGGLIVVLIAAAVLMAATGKLMKMAQLVKKGSHNIDQRRRQRVSDGMFETDTMLDDDLEMPARRRPTQQPPRRRDVPPPRRRTRDDMPPQRGEPPRRNVQPRRRMYNEKIPDIEDTPAEERRAARVETMQYDIPEEERAAEPVEFTEPVVQEEPAKPVQPVQRRAKVEFLDGTEKKPSRAGRKNTNTVPDNVSIDDLKIEPDKYEMDEPEDIPEPVKPMPKMKRAEESPAEETEEYNYPPIDLLNAGENSNAGVNNESDLAKAKLLEETLSSFGIRTSLTGIAHGPAVTRFELYPAPGVKVSRITGLTDNIALNLAARSVRIEAPIPGKAAVGVEIPNDKVETVNLRNVLESPDARRHVSRIAVGMGMDNSGRYIVADIEKMPHVLIAGQTGSGKSVCINSIIVSILYRATPDEVKMILIDPKVVELSVYNGIPHLIAPVVTDPKKASSALDWAVSEMTTRYAKFSERNVRNIKGYNNALKPGEKKMPQIVIVIDELADLMMVCPGEVEDSVCRLAQLARAAGMHLVIATQRPSVNVITGIIKANIPTRIAFLVASQVDSRTIIDHGGAEKLLGNGDMLFVPAGIQKPMRVQGAWVSDEEVNAVVEYVKERHETVYDEDVLEKINNAVKSDAEKEEASEEYDPRLPEAVEIVMEAGQASISMLQRRMRVGYARAGRLIDDMYQRGIVSEADGAKPRTVLISREQYERLFDDDI